MVTVQCQVNESSVTRAQRLVHNPLATTIRDRKTGFPDWLVSVWRLIVGNTKDWSATTDCQGGKDVVCLQTLANYQSGSCKTWKGLKSLMLPFRHVGYRTEEQLFFKANILQFQFVLLFLKAGYQLVFLLTSWHHPSKLCECSNLLETRGRIVRRTSELLLFRCVHSGQCVFLFVYSNACLLVTRRVQIIIKKGGIIQCVSMCPFVKVIYGLECCN